MACIPGLNPPKTLGISSSSSSSIGNNLLFSSSARTHLKITQISKRFPKISIVMATKRQESELSLNALTSSDRRDEVMVAVKSSLSNCLSETNLHLAIPDLKSKTRGKVRDIYDEGDYLVLVTTDRQSAFDRILASIPFKGQVLNDTSLWWFNQTQHIAPNAIIAVPDRNVTIAKKCSVFPVEFVVRGYMTGSTDTSLWTVYKNGVRNYCGNVLPEGMVKNERLPANIITPTTKAADHDVPITPDEVVRQGLMSQADYDEASRKALSLFEYGQRVASEHGLILVDTKYEFGKGPDGSVLLIDEVHTPDSSRYWLAHSYEARFQNGHEPENIDKEFLRLWFKDHCNPYEDKVLPDAPEELVTELAWRYIFLFETITKSRFQIPETREPIHDRISRNVSKALLLLKK
ncbi:phosphoribosylaminoimidazole-succinocarboxamide synthase, chloroplastic isoform X1 [Cynara cardunculus var. scolymus]|uniref:phosphoribosylaminoimidazole-succinocarboxamide synthase, chloroplastic isoform X1 n=2 Tax=Cynara cardunculus var. scolymus TaxID=59895 RepID=UPI000D62F496|nr:phosphoribosylaminoimidazole-succinocarboxamide synthase, chloroplastic isoform X1 [Cynara cardunculus var. scolymus]